MDEAADGVVLSIARLSYVRCGSPGPEADDPKEARQLARRTGWDVRGKATYDMCPPCAHGLMWDSGLGALVPTTYKPAALPGWVEEESP